MLQDESSKTSIEEVRARISDMPNRCKLLVKQVGRPLNQRCGNFSYIRLIFG